VIFVVPEPKIISYLLVDPGKGAFFRRFGYDHSNWSRLQADLLWIAHHHPVTLIREVSFGRKYRIIGNITAPNGRVIRLITGWMSPTDEPELMRFITAYPA